MVSVLKIILFAATILSPVYAQNAAPPDLSQPIRSALDRLIKGTATGDPMPRVQAPAPPCTPAAPRP
jgi:hypothetical protein